MSPGCCCFALLPQAAHRQEEPQDSNVKDDDGVGGQVARVQCQQPIQRHLSHRRGCRRGRRRGNSHSGAANKRQRWSAKFSAGAHQKSKNQRGER